MKTYPIIIIIVSCALLGRWVASYIGTNGFSKEPISRNVKKDTIYRKLNWPIEINDTFKINPIYPNLTKPRNFEYDLSRSLGGGITLTLNTWYDGMLLESLQIDDLTTEQAKKRIKTGPARSNKLIGQWTSVLNKMKQ